MILASGGYPLSYEKGKEITLPKRLPPNVTIYHAGDKIMDGKLVTAGGRVLGITATADSLPEALDAAYSAAKSVHFEQMMYRRDIGQRALQVLEA